MKFVGVRRHSRCIAIDDGLITKFARDECNWLRAGFDHCMLLICFGGERWMFTPIVFDFCYRRK